MGNKHQVHNLFILDESGSMESIKKSIIDGFNEIVRKIKDIEIEFPEQEHFFSMISFNGNGIKILHLADPVSQIAQINSENYLPDNLTPLFDAIGFGVKKLEQFLENQHKYNVSVKIFTDGEENSSKEYNVEQIKNIIEEKKNQGWNFAYIGTDHDIEKMAKSIAIERTINFEKTDAGIRHCGEMVSNFIHIESEQIHDYENSI